MSEVRERPYKEVMADIDRRAEVHAIVNCEDTQLMVERWKQAPTAVALLVREAASQLIPEVAYRLEALRRIAGEV